MGAPLKCSKLIFVLLVMIILEVIVRRSRLVGHHPKSVGVVRYGCEAPVVQSMGKYHNHEFWCNLIIVSVRAGTKKLREVSRKSTYDTHFRVLGKEHPTATATPQRPTHSKLAFL